MTQTKKPGGRPPLHGKPMTNAERSKKLREERDAAGLKEMKVWLRPVEAVTAQKRFGGKQAEALAAAIRAALAAPMQEADGQITLLSDRMKVDEVKIELKKANDYTAAVEKENARLRKDMEFYKAQADGMEKLFFKVEKREQAAQERIAELEAALETERQRAAAK